MFSLALTCALLLFSFTQEVAGSTIPLEKQPSTDESTLSCEALQKTIHTIYKTNEEIISRVEARPRGVTYTYTLFIDDDATVSIKELANNQTISLLLKAQKYVLPFQTNIWDVFNDNPNWGAQTWPDLKNLNKKLITIVDKFELLDKSNSKTHAELAKYLENFKIIQEALQSTENTLLSQKSRLDELNKLVVQANIALISLVLQGVNTRPPFESKILTNDDQQQQQLFDWYGSRWTLQYRATRDGWHNFHSKCDGKGPTLTIMKNTQRYIFGGYASVSWNNQGQFISDPEASLFALKDPSNKSPLQFPVANQNQGQALQGGHLGPSFGNCDLCVQQQAYVHSHPNSYTFLNHDMQNRYNNGFFFHGGATQLEEIETFVRY